MVWARRAQARETFGGGGEDGLGVGRAVEQREEVEDFLGSRLAPSMCSLWTAGCGIGKTAEIDADGRAAGGRLRAGGEAQVPGGLFGFGKIGDQAIAIVMRLDLLQFPPAQRTGKIASDNCRRGFEFEDFCAGSFQGKT